MTVLIPSYEPDTRLIVLINKIKALCEFNIVVVDDGSGNKFNHIFKSANELGCTVLTHKVNKGKGCALKTGFKYIKEAGEKEGVVCADSDGQHLPEDIMKIASKIYEYKNTIILGCRHFVGKVPARSRIGNSVTRFIYSISTGKKVYDTQTGLRGFSSEMFDWLCSIPGNRFEYEMNMLIDANKSGYSFKEVEIDTIYYESNKSSHFRPLIDSFKVYLPILKFSASSILSGILDFILLFLFQYITSNLLFSTVAARILSSILNFIVNKTLVFINGNSSNVKTSLFKYYTLAITVFLLNYIILSTLNERIGIPLFFAKIITEGLVFLYSYWAQHKFVFKNIDINIYKEKSSL